MCAIQIQPVISTPRLRLRAARKSDAGRVATLLNDLEVARMKTSVPHPYSLEDAQAYLGRGEAGENLAMFAIDHPDAGLVGVVGLEREGGSAELGYWLGRPFWGQGFATEAAKGALVWASTTWNQRYVWSRHFADNAGSAGVLCKAGFLYTGEVKLSTSLARGEAVPSRMMVWLA